MKRVILKNSRPYRAIIIALALFASLGTQAQTYTSKANGAWTSASTWAGGNIPPTNGNITAGMVVNIQNIVTYSGSNLNNAGTINISNSTGAAPSLKLGSGINFTNKNTGVININGAQLRQYRFAGGGESGTSQNGSFVNDGGQVYITNSFVEIAQKWTNQNSGIVSFRNSSLELGQDYIVNGAIDSVMITSISVGMQGNGNFQVSGNQTKVYYNLLRVEVASSNGNFDIKDGTFNGSIDYVTLHNHVTGTTGNGAVTLESNISTTSGLSLNNYCVSQASNYVSNAKVGGTQVENCSLAYFPASLMNPVSAMKLNYSIDPTLVSGNALSVGAIYKYENVKPGMDVTVSIDSIANGAVINTIDDNTGQNGGFKEAFQPIMTSGQSVGSSFAVFTFKFLVTGTSSPLAVDTSVITALDIDGNSNIFEFDQIGMGPGATAAFLTTSPAISLIQIPSTGTFLGTNVDGINQPGVDTTAKGNMFTVTNTNISTFTAKLGMITTTPQQTQRLFSLYTSNFAYPIFKILPVTLESFTAMLDSKNKKVDLNWRVSQQVNLSHYVVERSFDGTNFSDVGIVFADDQAAQTTGYRFPDNIANVTHSMIYYRLCAVDIDGAEKYSEVREIRISKQGDATIAIVTYPNPTVSTLNVTIPSSWQNKKVSYELYNFAGERCARVDEANAGQTKTLDVHNLIKGVYVVKASCEGQSAVQKVSKN